MDFRVWCYIFRLWSIPQVSLGNDDRLVLNLGSWVWNFESSFLKEEKWEEKSEKIERTEQQGRSTTAAVTCLGYDCPRSGSLLTSQGRGVRGKKWKERESWILYLESWILNLESWILNLHFSREERRVKVKGWNDKSIDSIPLYHHIAILYRN